MSLKIKELLKSYMELNQYREYNEVLKKEITYKFVKKIQDVNKNYLYSTQVELLEATEMYLENKDRMLFRKYYYTLRLDIGDINMSERLMEIYEKLV